MQMIINAIRQGLMGQLCQLRRFTHPRPVPYHHIREEVVDVGVRLDLQDASKPGLGLAQLLQVVPELAQNKHDVTTLRLSFQQGFNLLPALLQMRAGQGTQIFLQCLVGSQQEGGHIVGNSHLEPTQSLRGQRMQAPGTR